MALVELAEWVNIQDSIQAQISSVEDTEVTEVLTVMVVYHLMLAITIIITTEIGIWALGTTKERIPLVSGSQHYQIPI